jgi:FkbM family methyltransferase
MEIKLESFLDFCKGKMSPSQTSQDLLVLFLLGNEPGYFVEFGACDGIFLSNTLLLERTYKWDGLLIEPLRHYNKDLEINRRCKIEKLCISDKSNEQVLFSEVKGFEFHSGISEHCFNDEFANKRMTHQIQYEVETISLVDVLNKHNAPDVIDYMSIDTEGSELAILEAYDFSREFKIITVEACSLDSKSNDKIKNLLISKGYVNIFPEISKWDLWFIASKFF